MNMSNSSFGLAGGGKDVPDFASILGTVRLVDVLQSVFGKYESFSSVPQALLASDRGTFAKVQVGIHRRTKAQLAVKIMDHIRFGSPEHSGGTDIEKEVAILRSVNHVSWPRELSGSYG